MKKSIQLLASALFLSVALSSSVFATDDTTDRKKVFTVAVFPTVDASRLWVCLQKYQSENAVTLRLVEEQGEVLYQETMLGKRSRQNACRQSFDISQLPDGRYTFQITAGTQQETVTFQLGTPAPQTQVRLIALN